MSKLPTADKITDIDFCIKEGRFVNAIKMFRDITDMDLPRAKRVVELQTSGPRATMDRSGVLNAYDGLWEYFKSLHVYDSQIDDLHKTVQRMTDQIQFVENERDEYKSRLNAMRTTAGLEPVAPQTADNNAPYDNNLIQSIKDPEICALDSMVETLLELDTEARCRVLDYLQRRFE